MREREREREGEREGNSLEKGVEEIRWENWYESWTSLTGLENCKKEITINLSIIKSSKFKWTDSKFWNDWVYALISFDVT